MIFSPDFPATCPYITTVGATTLPLGANASTDAEVAVTRFGSGGGFSNIYPIPSYQSDAVNGYITNTPPPYPSYSGNDNQNIGANGGLWNSAGRGYPAVSAVGDNIVIFNSLLPTISTAHLSL
jgi:tripeptidyl-peptidase I